MDLEELIDENESYYSMFRTARPAKHVKGDDRLSVFRPDAHTIESAWWAVPRSFAARVIKPASKPTGARPPREGSKSAR